MSGRRVVLPGVDDTRALGRVLGSLLRAGDLVVLTGSLGAGKTTLTQGIGEGLGVRGPVTSPTFVIARVHPSTVGGPALVIEPETTIVVYPGWTAHVSELGNYRLELEDG